MSRILRVAVTMRRSDATTYVEPRDALARDWVTLLEAHGCAPVLVPGPLSDPVGFARALGVQAVLLSNGEDPETDPARDRVERDLLDWVLPERIPTLAVCRGLQVTQLHLGGALQGDVAGHVAQPHPIALRGDLARALRREAATVNSFHRLAAREPAPALEPLAFSADGCLEVARHREAPLLAVQWHPERPGVDADLRGWALDAWLAPLREGTARGSGLGSKL